MSFEITYSSLKDKKIILISPRFFKYEESICAEIKREGGEVHYYDERNNPSSFEKIILRKIPKVLTGKINKYYKLMAEKEKSFNPDFVVVISPETMTPRAVKLLRETFKSAKFILYMWDSIENKNAKQIYQLFDVCKSFDQKDCKKYGFIFRPLFFIPEYEIPLCPMKQEKNKREYDLSFIGSAHSDRAKILWQIEKYCMKNNLSYYFYIYFPGNLMLIVRSVFDKYVRRLDSKNFYTVALSKTDASEILSNTNCIIDINHPNQVGLTMRTIEMLGQQKKILTTNPYIKDYDFYNSLNDIIIDRHNFCFDISKLSNAFIPTDKSVYEKYTLRYWINEIIK